MIQVEDLYKYYGDRRAIGPVTTTIAKGEVVGLLGLNGAGKTTTLRVLACDLLPTSGMVRVDGYNVVEQPHEVRMRIGYLPDLPPLYGDMTVSEYLRYAARLRGVPSREVDKRVQVAEELTELGSERGRLIGALSHGYRQRVGIAQAIVHRPAFVVLDEPISGLDPAQIVEMRSLVRSLRGEHTVVISSHILSEISETCDRILVIRDGTIVASGTEAELAASQRGMRVDVTVAGGGEGVAVRASALLGALPGVTAVEPVNLRDQSEDAVSFRVASDRDVRAELCQALVRANFGLLEVAHSERELENIFLELSSGPGGRSGRAHAPAPAVSTTEASA
ncbi:MAG TPA: ABC transporter ATP-binding protein [Polyangiaceae bacterium]